MNHSRRDFLCTLPTITAGAALAFPSIASATGEEVDKHHWVMVIDVQKCIACQACTVSCIMENAVPENSFRTFVPTYEVHEGKQAGVFMLARLCNHCTKPPCVPVCPVGATFKLKNGVVVVDSNRCVGCGYCVQACPYEARFINHDAGTADKCTFCLQRVAEGLLPACVETCVGKARVFGDMNDPNSEVRKLAEKNKLKVLKPESGTQPNVFYLGLDKRFQGSVKGKGSLWQPSGHGG